MTPAALSTLTLLHDQLAGMRSDIESEISRIEEWAKAGDTLTAEWDLLLAAVVAELSDFERFMSERIPALRDAFAKVRYAGKGSDVAS